MDYRNPDYVPIFAERIKRLERMRQDPSIVPILKTFYRSNPIQFISDWGVTLDPRNVKRKLPAVLPLVLFPRQIEWLEEVLDCWHNGEPLLTEKSRDMGCSVSIMALFCTLSIFNDSFVAGVGSRKETLVDKVGDPDTLFYKGRMFLENIPREFRGGWDANNKALSSHLKLEIPDTGSVIRGEAGNNIGRGGRASIYLVDESAFLAQPQQVEASLSQTTDCRIDLSSVNGMDNPFAEKRHSGKVRVFTFHWRNDPRKDDAWYALQVKRLNPIIVAAEIDLDYSASKQGVLIPSAWVQAAIDAHVKLDVLPTGARKGALDVADEGVDLNAFAARYGFMLESVESWSGKGGDIFNTVEKSALICDQRGLAEFDYDADGLGVGVRGDMRVINDRRELAGNRIIAANAFQGSGAVVDPDEEVIKTIQTDDGVTLAGRTNKDFFANRKAQGWWRLRTLFQNTYRAVVEQLPFDPDELISIPGNLPELLKLQTELSQPTYSINTAGKILVDKAPEGQRSPNHADAVMIVYAPAHRKKSSIFD